MDSALIPERRSAPRIRFIGGVLPPTARLRHGDDVVLVDLSSTGALIEGCGRLRPGARVELRVGTAGDRLTIPARVHRCFVWALDRLAGVRYRAALVFERHVEVSAPRDLLAEYAGLDRTNTEQ